VQKNLIIGGLIVWNLILMAALAFIWAGSRSPQPAGRQPGLAEEPGPAEQTVQLNAGDRLVGEKALRIADRDVTITTTFDIQDEDGVIVAHGGLAHGYALYVQQTQLLFIVRRNNALTTVDGGYLKPGRHTVSATLARTGDMNLIVDGQAARKGRAAGAITLEPVDGLEAGGDRGAPVGPYQTPNDFGGTIASVTVSSARH
jgi:hypothetical protein